MNGADASSTKLLDQATTLPGKKMVSEAIGVVIERVQDKVKPLEMHHLEYEADIIDPPVLARSGYGRSRSL